MEDKIVPQRQKQEEKIHARTGPIDWNELLGEIDFLSLKILDHIYLKDELTLHKLSKGLTKFGVSSSTVKNRLLGLEDWGLIELVSGSNPLCVVKRLNLEDRIKKLVLLGYGKFEVKRDE